MAVTGIEPISYATPARSVHRVEETRRFTIPQSPLRTEESSAVPAAKDRDPAADAVDLTRDFPALLLNQAYPLPAEQPPPGASPTATDGTGLDQSGGRRDAVAADTAEDAAETGDNDDEEEAAIGDETDAQGRPLDESEERQVDELQARDREVRIHEQAHKSAGGQYAGAISYEYQQGPDGKRYAVGGEVSINVSPENDPAATITKMRQVRAAALAPAEPSGQDRSVAAQAMQLENEARQELQVERSGGNQDGETKEGEAEESNSGAAATRDAASGSDVGGANAPSRSTTGSAVSVPESRAGGFRVAALSAAGRASPLDVYA